MDSPNPNSSISNNMTSPPFWFRDINWDTVTKDDRKFRAMASHKLGESFIQELSSADTDTVIEAALSCFTLAELQHAYALMVGGTDTDTHIDSDSFKCTDSAIRAILNVMPNDKGEDADSPAHRPAHTAAAAGAAAPSPTPSSPAAPQPAPTAAAGGAGAGAAPSSPAPAPSRAPATVATSTATPVVAATTKVKAVVGVDNVSGSVSVTPTPNNRGDGSPNPKR